MAWFKICHILLQMNPFLKVLNQTWQILSWSIAVVSSWCMTTRGNNRWYNWDSNTYRRRQSCLRYVSTPPDGSPWWPAQWAALPSAETPSWPRPSPDPAWSRSSCTQSSRPAAPNEPSLQLTQGGRTPKRDFWIIRKNVETWVSAGWDYFKQQLTHQSSQAPLPGAY